jgi:hypothetical protein
MSVGHEFDEKPKNKGRTRRTINYKGTNVGNHHARITKIFQKIGDFSLKQVKNCHFGWVKGASHHIRTLNHHVKTKR